jgi:predicted amidohydrolase YtcJ
MRVLYNAKIHTLDGDNPTATAIAIDQGRIIALGDDQKILSDFKGHTKPLNLGGSPVIPGLTDAHIHLQQYALNLQKIDCEVDSREECIRRVAERVQITSPGKWVSVPLPIWTKWLPTTPSI